MSSSITSKHKPVALGSNIHPWYSGISRRSNTASSAVNSKSSILQRTHPSKHQNKHIITSACDKHLVNKLKTLTGLLNIGFMSMPVARRGRRAMASSTFRSLLRAYSSSWSYELHLETIDTTRNATASKLASNPN